MKNRGLKVTLGAHCTARGRRASVWLCRNWIFVVWKPTWYFAALGPRFVSVIFPIIEAIVRPGSPLSFSARQIRRASSIDGTGDRLVGDFNCANRGGFEGFVSLKEYSTRRSEREREMNTQRESICLFIYSRTASIIDTAGASRRLWTSVWQNETEIACGTIKGNKRK